jgi:hypothetical protein
VNASNKTPLVDPQGVQPEKSTGKSASPPITSARALLKDMSRRCKGHSPNPRFLAFTEHGNVALLK